MAGRGLSFVWVTAGVVGVFVGACSAGGGETIGTTSQAMTFTNDKPAYDYFVAKGLTSFQAAGIVGNLDQESGVDPTAVQAGGPGRGIAQWSVGGRWDTDTNDNATWYAAKEGETLLSLTLQLDFIWYELTTFPDYGLAALKATTNVTDATVAFETDFEGCGTCDQSTRVAYAENVLGAFGGDAGHFDAGTSGSDSGIGTPCTLPSTGQPGECMDTATCASLGGHESTPDLCPGPSNVQCCTAISLMDGGDDAANDAAASSGTPDAGGADAGAGAGGGGAEDAGAKHGEHPGGAGGVVDATAPGNADGGKPEPGSEASSPSAASGCGAAPNGARGADRDAWVSFVGAFALVVAGRRRRKT